MNSEKEYYAFISYKREDEKWARWLQNKLEHYRFPTNLNGRTDLPPNIHPIFRDVTDLTPGLLSEEINKALRSSEWLIVICSPRSARSPWVCKEAQTFIDLGYADHIIPFIIEGTPFSQESSDECYPKALLELTGSKEVLAANIDEMGRDAAVIKVVARMFGLKFDSLWQRHEREQRRNRLLIIIGTFLFVLTSLFLSGYFIRQNQIIQRQRDRLREDSVVLSSHVHRILKDSIMLSNKNDSIVQQNVQISEQRNKLSEINERLEQSNCRLKEERENLRKSNWEILKQRARAVADIADGLVDKGDYYTARLLALDVLPTDSLNIDKPYEPVVEAILRKALERDGFSEEYSSIYPHVSVLSPNAKKVFVLDGTTIKIVDTSEGHELVRRKDGERGSPLCFWDPKGNNIAIVSNSSIEVLDVITLKPYLYVRKAGCGVISSACFSKGGREILYAIDSIVYRLDLKTLVTDTILCGHSDVINKICNCAAEREGRGLGPRKDGASIATDSLIITASADKTVRIWNAETGELKKTLLGHSEGVNHLSYSFPAGKIVSADSREIIVWDIESGDSCFSILSEDSITSLSLSGVRYIMTTSGGVLKAYRITDGKKVLTKSDYYYVNSQGAHDDNYLYDGFDSDEGRIWGVFMGTSYYDDPYARGGHNAFVTDVAFSPDGRIIVSASNDSTIAIRNSRGTVKRVLKGHMGSVTSVDFHPEGKFLASSSRDSTVKIWKVEDGSVIKTFGNLDGPVNDVSFSSDGKLLLLVFGEYVHIYDNVGGDWNLNNFLQVKGVEGAKFSFDGKYIALRTSMVMKIWGVQQNQYVYSYNSLIFDLDWHPYKHELAIQIPDSILLLDMKSNIVKERWKAPGLNVAYSTNGEWIANTDLGILRIWHAQTGTLLKSFAQYSGFLGRVSFNPNGSTIVTDDAYEGDFGVTIWRMRTLESIASQVRKQFKNRRLSEKERWKYGLD